MNLLTESKDTIVHHEMSREEHMNSTGGKYVDPDKYRKGHKDYHPAMSCKTGNGHAKGTRSWDDVTCPKCLEQRPGRAARTESAEPERKFYLREIETNTGTYVWQYGNDRGAGVRWYAGNFKTSGGAVKSAMRTMMNPNQRNGYSSEYFKNPIIAETLPITAMANPFNYN